jgi:hypothetical protein
MGVSYPDIRLLDGPLLAGAERRQHLVQMMATDLVAYDALHNEQDAVRSLYGRGYRTPDIMSLLDEARALAFQDIVAKEMSAP